jgi:hypothetical protein
VLHKDVDIPLAQGEQMPPENPADADYRYVVKVQIFILYYSLFLSLVTISTFLAKFFGSNYWISSINAILIV